MSNLEDFDKEIVCFYKEERYAVRNNGAILRYPIDGKKNVLQTTIGLLES